MWQDQNLIPCLYSQTVSARENKRHHEWVHLEERPPLADSNRGEICLTLNTNCIKSAKRKCRQLLHGHPFNTLNNSISQQALPGDRTREDAS